MIAKNVAETLSQTSVLLIPDAKLIGESYLSSINESCKETVNCTNPVFKKIPKEKKSDPNPNEHPSGSRDEAVADPSLPAAKSGPKKAGQENVLFFKSFGRSALKEGGASLRNGIHFL